MLPDHEIVEAIARGEIDIDPLPLDAAIQSCSVELHLAKLIKVPTRGVFRDEEAPHYLPPGAFALASTIERITVPAHLACEVYGKSSIGREGLAVHITAGLVDPGFSGDLTLELYNHSPWLFRLVEGMAICQIVFYRLGSAALRPYGHPSLGSHYQGQRGATPSRRDQ